MATNTPRLEKNRSGRVQMSAVAGPTPPQVVPASAANRFQVYTLSWGRGGVLEFCVCRDLPLKDRQLTPPCCCPGPAWADNAPPGTSPARHPSPAGNASSADSYQRTSSRMGTSQPLDGAAFHTGHSRAAAAGLRQGAGLNARAERPYPSRRACRLWSGASSAGAGAVPGRPSVPLPVRPLRSDAGALNLNPFPSRTFLNPRDRVGLLRILTSKSHARELQSRLTNLWGDSEYL